MAFSDIDKTASAKWAPSKLLKKIAERSGADIRNAKSEEEARRWIDEAKAKKPKADAAKDGEVLPPLKNGAAREWGPHIAVHIPSVSVDARDAPAWYDMVGHVKDAALYMVLGAALYATVGRLLGF